MHTDNKKTPLILAVFALICLNCSYFAFTMLFISNLIFLIHHRIRHKFSQTNLQANGLDRLMQSKKPHQTTVFFDVANIVNYLFVLIRIIYSC